MKLAASAACVAALTIWLGPSPANAPESLPRYMSDAAYPVADGKPSVEVFTFDDLPKAWQRLAMCESSGRGDVTAGSRDQFQGYFQIEYPRTWLAHGGVTRPVTAASLSEQWAVALHIFADRGSNPWPSCGRYLREVYGR